MKRINNLRRIVLDWYVHYGLNMKVEEGKKMARDIKNALVKVEYIKFMREVDGLSAQTIRQFENAIAFFDSVVGGAEYGKLSKAEIIRYKTALRNKKRDGKPISVSTVDNNLMRVFNFFRWLSQQPGYRRNLPPDKVHYLKPSRKERQTQRYSGRVVEASFSTVVELFNSITGHNQIDLRDRAAIAFLLSTGIRVDAFISLPISVIDEETLLFDQAPGDGVRTKFGKLLLGKVHNFNEHMTSAIKEWLTVYRGLGAAENAPFFPQGKTKTEELAYSIQEEVSFQPYQATGGMREMLKRRCAKAGIKNIAPHDFRHIFMIEIFKRVEKMEDLKVISQSIGHESLSTTFSSYGNYSPNILKDRLQHIDLSLKKKLEKERLGAMMLSVIDQFEQERLEEKE